MGTCKDCDNTGYIYKRHRENQALYVFKCYCLIGHSRPQQYTVWDDKLNVTYESEPTITEEVIKGSFLKLVSAPEKKEPDQSVKEDERDFSVF